MKKTFTGKIKEEISKHNNAARHCQLAEMAVFLSCCGRYDNGMLCIRGENPQVMEKISQLMERLYRYEIDASEKEVRLEGKDADGVLESLKVRKENITGCAISEILLNNHCCKQAALTAFFLCTGSVNDPSRNYHCEYVCVSGEQAAQIVSLLGEFGIVSHRTRRKGREVVYIKESESISELLGVIGAHKEMMELENLRIEKELRSSVNRAVNCDTANAKKLADASTRQIEDIKFLRDSGGLANLPDQLKEMAKVRLENPELPLKDLGALLDPPIGKSGVNHRLRKLSELADKKRTP